MNQFSAALFACWGLALAVGCLAITPEPSRAGLERIQASADGAYFVGSDSGQPFVAWGFNYDHDATGRLIEDYWDDEWSAVVQDFQEKRDLGQIRKPSSNWLA